MEGGSLRILWATPAFWPAHAFGGPVIVARELVGRLVSGGHAVQVMTTSLLDVSGRAAARTRVGHVDGAEVTYLGTPLHYRWMGITPALPRYLHRIGRPDVVHVMGFRDPVTTGVAAWCRARSVPYVFEPVGMLRPRLRKVRGKQVFDRTIARGVAGGARLVIVSSEREREDAVTCGVEPLRIRLRGNAFPDPPQAAGGDPLANVVAADARVVLYVGRIAAEKGIEHLLSAARALPEIEVVLAGPDDRHGTVGLVHAAMRDPATAGRIHLLPPTPGPPYELYRRADVFVLASGGENFGLVAAEAASVGTPVIVSDRSGVASAFGEGEALVVPYEREATVRAIERVVGDPELRSRLGRGALAAASRSSWAALVEAQEKIYAEALAEPGERASRRAT